ncbi:unnamed protein product [Symbiodinium sp. CCMP2592]|nr:unnamed protein product [Symbiodinium sp. CCMP2592]
MDVDDAGTASSGRRPRAKARPRRGDETISSDLILIRYETQHNCGREVTNRRGIFNVCGVEIKDMGLENTDTVIDLIEQMSDHRDRCLPQRGDQPLYARDVENGGYANHGYQSIGDRVTGGILDLIPLRGARFVSRQLGHYRPCCLEEVDPSNSGYC